MDSIQNVVQNAQKIVDNIGKQPHRSSSKELQRSHGRQDYDFRPQNAYLRTSYLNSQALTTHKGYQSDYNRGPDDSHISASRNEQTSVETMTNLERYKQKLKTQRVPESSSHHHKSHAPSLTYKASVRDTVSKLQEQSRLNGGAYGTNQFSSVGTSDKREDNTKGRSKRSNNRGAESDTERLEDDTNSEDGLPGNGAGPGGLGNTEARDGNTGEMAAEAEYA